MTPGSAVPVTRLSAVPVTRPPPVPGMLRGGYALVFSLMVVLSLSVAALGIMAIGLRESVVAAAVARVETARAAAEGAAVRVVRDWSTRLHADLATGQGRTVAVSPGTVARVERLDAGLFLVRGEATVDGPSLPTRAVAGLLVRILDPVSLQAAMPAAATIQREALLIAGEVSGLGSCGEPDGIGIATPDLQLGPDASVHGAPAHTSDPAPAMPHPDPFAQPLVSRLADVQVQPSTVSPRPAGIAGACTPDERNWGAPDPAHPCHPLLPLVHSLHSLTLEGGEARGILVVDGDLLLDGTRFAGVILVRGTLSLDRGASVLGAVRADRLHLHDGLIHGDPCEIRAALGAPALDRPFRSPDRLWVPLF